MQRALSGRGTGLCVRIKTRMVLLKPRAWGQGLLMESVAAESYRLCLQSCVLYPESHGNVGKDLKSMTAMSASTGNRLHGAGVGVDTRASSRSLGRPPGHGLVVECSPGVLASYCDKPPRSKATWRAKGLFPLTDKPSPIWKGSQGQNSRQEPRGRT